MPIGPPEGFLDITNATLRTSVVGISNTGPTGELSVGSNLHVDTTASNVLQVVGNVSVHNMTLGEIRMLPAHGLENVTEVGNTTPFTVSFSNATTGLATTSNLHVGGTLKIGTVEFENPLSLAAVSLVSNTTPYTIEFSNAATGLATTANVDVGGELTVTGNATVSSNLTVSGNATVTGDLNVSGALGILDAIYPVGTVIDRATAITDTHPNGKYKAFLAAPNQEWELVSDGQNKVLENLTSLSNTTSLHGRATIDNVTTYLNLTTTWQLLTGSSVTDYVPPVGTNSIIYKVRFHSHYDADASVYMKSQLQFKVGNGSWTTVTKANRFTVNYEDYDAGMKTRMWIFKVNSIDDSSVGSFSAATPTLSFRTMVEEQSGTQEVRLHYVRIMGTDTVNGETALEFTPPIISVTAIGTKSLEYKRTV